MLALEVACFSVFILWVLKTGASGEKPFTGVRPYIPLLLFVFICFLQIVPLPGFILGVLSGKSLEVWETTGKALSSLGAAAGNGFHTISIYPDATLRKILLLLAYAAFGLAVSRSFRSDGWIKLALAPVFAMLFLEASLGIYQYLGSGGGEDATGTYFNRNHYAGFLEMSLPLALGCVFSLGDWTAAAGKPFMKRLVSSENFQKQLLFLFLLGVVLLAVLFSRSRMGIFSTVVSLLFFSTVCSRFVRRGLEIKWMVYMIFAVALFFGIYIGFYPLIERYWLIEKDLPARTLVWTDVISTIRDFPLFGTGLGTFGYIYPLYNKSLEKPIIYLYTHNDYLQVLVETGVAGLLSIMTALCLFIFSSLKTLVRLSREHDYFRFFISLGALTGIFSILVHSFVDFGLQIPSNGLYFAFLIGLSAGAGSGSEKDGGITASGLARKQ